MKFKGNTEKTEAALRSARKSTQREEVRRRKRRDQVKEMVKTEDGQVSTSTGGSRRRRSLTRR